MRYPRATQTVAANAAASIKLRPIHVIILVAIAVAGISILLLKASPSVESKEMTTVFAANRGGAYVNLKDGKALRVSKFDGPQDAADALRTGAASARSLTRADFDGNGTPDVVAGYALNNAGLLTIHQGNPEAYAPTDETIYTRIQQGYNPEPLLPQAQVYQLPEPVDFLAAGDFNRDSEKDILAGSRNGSLFLLARKDGVFESPIPVSLPGALTALTTGEFRAADGKTDIAIAVDGFNGPQVLVYDGHAALNGEPMIFQLSAPAVAVEFGELDSDPFLDLSVIAGNEAVFIHGWGRNRNVNPQRQVEKLQLGFQARGMALGLFVWNRDSKKQVAILGDSGTTQIFHSGELRAQPFTEQELAERGKGRLRPKRTDEDVESVVGWQPSAKQEWDAAREFHTNTDTGAAGNRLFKAHLSGAETDNLMFLDSRSEVKVVQQFSQKYAPEAQSIQGTTDISEASLSLVGQPTAILAMPPKINGERSLIMLQSGLPDLATVPENVVVASTVDRTDDTNSAAAQVCGAGLADCSLRGAITKANGNATDPTNPAANVITVPNGTYLLTINGAGGCVNGAESNANGDLEINNSTTIVGGGMTTTIIRQTGTGNAGFPGDRVMCLNTAIVTNRDYVFSGFTMAGGFDRSSIGGGGLVGGAKDNFLSLTNIRITNNDNTALNNYSGGGLSITGGDVTITNSLIGGPTAADADPATSNDRTDLTRGNYAGTAGGGVGYSPGDPNGALPSPGVLTITGTTIQGNKAKSGASGGGGADLFFHNGGTGSFTINGGSIIDSNIALQGNGGGVLVESLHLTVDNSTFTNNATVLANTRGGAIYLSGGGLSFGSSTSFSNNSVGAGVVLGKAISVNTGGSPTTGVFVTGGSNNINDNVEILPNGTWTNNAGTSVTFLNLTLAEGTFVGNNSTLTINQDLNLNSFATADSPIFTGGSGTHTITGNLNIVEGTYTATSGTTNMAGNFNLTGGSFVHNSGTFIFNGTGAQSITGAVTFFNLTDSNITQPLTINSSIGANGSLNVNGTNAVLAPVAASVISGSGTLTGTGTARVTRTAATADFSTQYSIANKTLTNLTVEYIGGAVQVLSPITYGPLKINNASGVNLAGVGTATVGGLLTLQTGALGVGTGTLVINNGSSVVSGSITSGATGTVNYNQGSVGQNVLAFNYGNLIFSNFNKNLPASTVGIAGTFTPGTAIGHTITGNTINFNGAGAQTVPAFQYNNLTISGARGGASVTLVNGGTISVLGAFSPTATAVNYVVTNNTFDFNSTGAQTVAAFNYNNLTISQNRGGAALTLASGNIGIAGVFNPTLTNNTFVTAGNTVIFNGSALQTIPAFTFNGLTISNAAGVNLSGPVTVGGALSLTSGAFGVGTHTLTLNGAASTSGGTLTSSNTGTVNYNQGSNGQGVLAGSYGNLTFSNFNKTLASTGTIGISNVFTPGTATGHTITGSTIDFNGTGAQTVPAFNYNNLTISGARGANNVTLANSGIIGIAGVFSPTATFAGGSIVITGSTIEYNGTSAQTMPATFTTYNNLNLNNTAGVAGFAGLTVQGLLNVKAGTFTSSSFYNNVTIDALATLTATAGSTINVTGNWINNGTFNGSTGTVAFNGLAAQTIGGSAVTAFTNLTIANSAGVSLNQNATVNGTLTLNSDLTTGANTLTQPSTAPASAGAFDVVGNVRRTGTPLPTAVAMTFGNLNNIITFDAVGTTPNDVTINLVKAAPGTFPSAVQRTYTITPTGGAGFSGTLRLRYLDVELNGNIESQLDLWRFNGATFIDEQQTSRDSVNNWVQKTGVTTFSPWTFATHVNAVPSVTPATTVVNAQTTSGLVITADAIDGAAVTHFKITNIANGTLFKNDGVTAINNNDFITLAEGNAGLKFTPALNSIAAGSFSAQSSSDAIGTGLSTAATGTITVNQGSTTTTITLDSPDPSGTGVSVTVNFTVAVDLPSSGTPTGNVVVTVNDASGDTCNGNLSGGSGTCNLTLTTSGSKTLTATYGGDTLFTTSFDTEPHVVNGPPVAVDDSYSSLKGSTLNVAAPGVLANDTGNPTDVTAIAAGPTTAGGTVTLNTNGSFTYNPPTAVFTGADSFTYTANNAFGSDSGTVNITVVEAFFINEVLFDPPGTDAPNEYIELRGPASSTIPAGTYLVAIEGDSAENPGDVQTIINLSGLSFGSNGFLVLLQNGNTYTTAAGTTVLTSTTAGFGGLPGAIFSADAAATDLEDSSVSFLLIQTGTAPTLTDDIDTDDNGSTNAPYSGWTVLDSIGALNAGANVRGYAAYHYRNVAGTGSSIGAETIVNFIPSYVGRNGDSIGATAADWVASGGLAGTAPNFTLNATDTEPIAFANQPLNHIGATNFDITPPTVQSITRASTNPTNAASVDFTVTFSENVTGVDAADFALTTTGTIAGASVGLIGAVGNVWTVTVNTGTGDGTIRLDLIDNNTIIDGSNNPLGGAGVQSFTTGEVYNVDKSIPTVNIVDVTPDPRSTSVSSISIVFSEAITGFDLADLSLTRNGGANLLTGSQTLTSGDNITWTLDNLSSITTSDGTYVLTLTAAGSSIADGVGNALAAGDSDTWLMDGNAPTVDITDVSPDPRNTAVGSIAIVFSEAISGFDLADLSLTRDGGANLLTGAQTLTSGDNINWTLGNLSGLTGTSGTYTLTLTAPGGITDGSANALAGGATDSWVMDTSAPTVDVVDVTPDPRNTSVTSISIVFSEAVTGFDLADLSLTRDGGANLLTGSQTLTSGDNITWTLGNLSTLTGADGNYALTLTSGGIADNAGNALAAGASDTWVVNGAPPTVDITDVTPDPRNTTVSSISIVFSEAVTGFDLADLSLTRDGGANLLTGAQTVTSGDNINWTLNNLAGLTGTDGTYTLTLTAPGGITDAGGASLTGGATDSWVMDATGPSVTINQASGQADPTSASPINFTVVFNEPVANFVTGDVALSGTAGATTAIVTETAPNNGTTYNVAVSGMTSSGTVIASLSAGVASDALGNLSQASTSTDNTVTFVLITNNAPVLDIAGNFSLNAIDEDISNASNTGTLISDIIASAGGDRITDADAGAVEGLAITGSDPSNGTWEFSIDNGASWTPLGTPDPTASRLLASDANTRLRFIPNANFNGAVNPGILFRAWDQTSGTNGGTADTTTNGGQTAFSASTDTASITVNAVNDAPSFTEGPDQVVGEDAGAQTVPGWATNILAGPANESGQTLTFLVTTNNDSLFAVLPAISPTGTLTYTPAANASGVITVFVALQDNGGGNDTSGVQTFTITINAVNDTPTANAQSVNTNEDTPLGITLTGSDPETPAGSLIFTVTVLPTNGVLSGTGANRTYTPNAGYNGPDSFKFTVTDTGTPALTSAEATVSITVDAVNDGPTNTVPGAQATNTNTALIFSAGNGNQISIADSDAGVAAVQVTLTATNGTLTLSTAGGLVFSVGDSTAEATMTFSGSVANINNALNGLAFTPTSGFSGAASLQIVTNDQGNTGSGGALSDTDSVNITVTSGGTLQFSSATYTVAENGGPATITITRAGGSAGTATVLFETSNGTADSGDYTTVSQTVTFVDGDTSETVNVPITNDTDPEADQTVNLTLSNAGGTGTLGAPSTAVLTITNDDIGGTLQFSAATYSVAENAGPAVITITRTGGASGTATVLFQTSNGTADSGDYTTVSETVTFLNGETSKTVNVPITNNTDNEPDQTVNLTLSNAGGTGTLGAPASAVLTIENDDQPKFVFASSTLSVGEAGPSLNVIINRTGDPNVAATVDVATNDFMAALCSTVAGTASAKCDYATAGGRLRFAAGQTSKTVVLSIVDDVFVEGNETLTMSLSNPTAGSALGTPLTTTITIQDNDSNPNAANPFPQNPFFVRMQYLDFLLREPDAPGFNDWLNVLNNCQPNQGFLGSDPACDRVHVSSGFFRSTEFGERGYWVYRFFEGSLGRRPTFEEFTPEMRRLSGLKPAAELDQDEADFINEFMAKAEFTAKYAGLTNAAQAAQFIAALEQTAGVTLPATVPPTQPGQPTQYGRQELINLMAAGTLTPAQTLRAFIEQKVVWDKNFFKAFVAMQYFGYLRRNPDNAGYDDWLDVLTNGRPAQGIPPGDFRHLVFGFVYSVEYRERFGQP